MGCDATPGDTLHPVTDFNPRTHVGCDYLCTVNKKGRPHFNPRTHVGCDPELTPHHGGIYQFQSTHPRGVRRILRPILARSTPISIHAPTWGATSHKSLSHKKSPYFNPRTHVGCDLVVYLFSSCANTFQSTHPRGVRLEMFLLDN